jgi:excisionase family DNA binding protein
MTARDVATYLNVDEKTVYRLAKRRGPPGFNVAGAWRFKKEDIDHWIEERKIGPAACRGGVPKGGMRNRGELR